MRSRHLVFLILAVIGLILVLAARIYTNAPAHAAIANLISDSWYKETGQRIRFTGDASISLFPLPQFVLQHSTIEFENGDSLKSEKITIDLTIMDFMNGEYRIKSIDIAKSEVLFSHIDAPQNNMSTEAFLQSSLKYVSELTTNKIGPHLTEIRISDVTVRFAKAAIVSPIHISRGSLTMDKTGAFSFDCEALYGSTPLAMRVDFDAPDRDNQARSTRIEYRDDAIKLTGKGLTAFDPAIQFVGDVNLVDVQIDKVLSRISGQFSEPFAKPGSLQARARISFSAITLSNIVSNIGKSNLSGNLMADFADPHSRITGTIAATEIDLVGFLSQLGLKRDDVGKWSRDQFNPRAFPELELDLRLSADRITYHDVVMKSVALSSLLKNQTLEMTLVGADLFDGTLTGKVQMAEEDETSRLNLKSTLNFDQIDLGRGLNAIMDTSRATGVLSGQIEVAASGQSAADLVGDLSGRIAIDGAQISVSGVNLLSFLHRLETRPLGATMALKGGTTEFDTAQFILDVTDGIGTLRNTHLTRLPDLQIKLNGQLNFVEQNMALTGHAIGSSSQGPDTSINLPFALKGPFENPAFLPDFMNISKQSGAIAP